MNIWSTFPLQLKKLILISLIFHYYQAASKRMYFSFWRSFSLRGKKLHWCILPTRISSTSAKHARCFLTHPYISSLLESKLKWFETLSLIKLHVDFFVNSNHTREEEHTVRRNLGWRNNLPLTSEIKIKMKSFAKSTK